MRGRRAKSARRAFTLVELMVVVAIIAVLAVLAIVAYRKIINSSHVAEATHMIQAIRVAQEAYHSETQSYANPSGSLTGAPYPDASGTPSILRKTAWGAACNSNCGADTWAALNVHVDGPVMFGYTSVSGVAGQTPNATISIGGNAVNLPAKPNSDWFLIGATCDVDGTGGTNWGAGNTSVYGTSFTNELWIANEGQ
jgi:type IV pilus assembly protein PilA